VPLSIALLVGLAVALPQNPASPLLPHPHPTDDTTVTATAFIKDGDVTVQAGLQDGGVAWVEFSHSLNTTGWSVLNIRTSGKFSDNDQAYAAGFLEGLVSAMDIYNTQDNLFRITFPNTNRSDVPDAVRQFLNDQEAWALDMVKANTNDAFWRQIGYIMQQYAGLEDGYKKAVADMIVPETDHFAFQLLNGLGDLFDIIPAVNPSMRIPWYDLDVYDAIDLHGRLGHCSGLVKVTGDLSDILMAHSSWFYFSNTNRIYKYYSFDYSDNAVAAKNVSFSSYPGFLESLDDFYLMSSGLGMIQTSNAVLDTSVYDNVTPHSLLAWQRVRAASALASSGPEWYSYFKRNHSGTYANQYMIVDYKLFTPGQPLVNDTLWVIEEIPGLIAGGDQTIVLSYGHWPSYNVPFWSSIYEASGYPKMVQSKGTYFSYQLAPRAKIFRRDANNVTDIDSLKTFMRSNNYRTDPYSFDGKAQNAMYAICSRGDLNSPDQAFGCYDTKVTGLAYGAKELKASAYNGPTTNGGTYSPFTWKETPSTPHDGLPYVYDFEFVDMQPKQW
jgi:hypothetical protein